MKRIHATFGLAAIVAVAGCTSIPTGPSKMALPGTERRSRSSALMTQNARPMRFTRSAARQQKRLRVTRQYVVRPSGPPSEQ